MPAIAELARRLERELGAELLAILLFGSIAFGSPTDHSDIDMIALTACSWRQVRLIELPASEAEVFITPIFDLAQDFVDMNQVWLIAFSRGLTLYDPLGLLAKVRERAAVVHISAAVERPSLPLRTTAEAGALSAFRLTRLERYAVETAARGDDFVALYIFLALRAALDIYYDVHRLPFVKPKRRLRDVAAHDATIALMASQAMDVRAQIHERLKSLEQLVERVLAPLGGRRTSWCSKLVKAIDAQY